MRVMNEIMADGERSGLPERINEVAGEGQQRRIDVGSALRGPRPHGGPSCAHIGHRDRSPLLRLARASRGRAAVNGLAFPLLFDGEFLSPLAELGFADARSREEELCRFFSD
jgi:hypothetical protein